MPFVATMNIKDPRVRELARELAALQGTSATAAVRGALEEALVRARSARVDRAGALGELQERVRATSDQWRSDHDLYDEHGLPR